MADQDPNADIKAKMREALDRKKGHHHPDDSADARETAHGAEVSNANVAKPMHRRKAGGGGV